MPRKPVSPEIADDIYKRLKDLGEGGGTWRDLFGLTNYAESVIRDALFALEKAGRATRTPQWKGTGRGGKPSLWRVKAEAEP